MTPSPVIPTQQTRILLVDDHPMVRDGLMQLIGRESDLTCCGEAGSVAEAWSAVAMHSPDLVILDLRLRGGDGLELIKSLKSQYPALRILVVSQSEPSLYAERVLRAGALGYVAKEQAADEVLNAIRTVLADEVYVTRGMAARLLHQFVGSTRRAQSAGVEHLTDRELHVLELLGAGMSTREVAKELNLSFKTIEAHRENIKQKLGLRGAAELLQYANRWAQEPVSLPSRTVAEKVAAKPRKP